MSGAGTTCAEAAVGAMEAPPGQVGMWKIAVLQSPWPLSAVEVREGAVLWTIYAPGRAMEVLLQRAVRALVHALGRAMEASCPC